MATSPLVMAPWPLPGDGPHAGPGGAPLPPYDVDRFIAPWAAGAGWVGGACGRLVRAVVWRALRVKAPTRALVPKDGEEEEEEGEGELEAQLEADAQRRRAAAAEAVGLGEEEGEWEWEGEEDSPQNRRGRPRLSATLALAAVRAASRQLAGPAPRARALTPRRANARYPTASVAGAAGVAQRGGGAQAVAGAEAGGGGGVLTLWSSPSTVGNALPDERTDMRPHPHPHTHPHPDHLLRGHASSEALRSQEQQEPQEPTGHRPYGAPVKVRPRPHMPKSLFHPYQKDATLSHPYQKQYPHTKPTFTLGKTTFTHTKTNFTHITNSPPPAGQHPRVVGAGRGAGPPAAPGDPRQPPAPPAEAQGAHIYYTYILY